MNRLSELLAAVKLNPSDIGYDNPIKSPDTAFANILTIVYAWAGIVAVLVLVIASYLFVTSRGDPAQMKRSKDAIRGAVVGLIVVILAFTITQFILGRF